MVRFFLRREPPGDNGAENSDFPDCSGINESVNPEEVNEDELFVVGMEGGKDTTRDFRGLLSSTSVRMVSLEASGITERCLRLDRGGGTGMGEVGDVGDGVCSGDMRVRVSNR